jgi:hypothetical protein
MTPAKQLHQKQNKGQRKTKVFSGQKSWLKVAHGVQYAPKI